MPQLIATDTFGSTHRTVVARGPRPSARRGSLAVDARLRIRFRNGDPDAVRAVYTAYGRLVYAVAYAILRERGLCEEATQQTFLKAWRGAGSIDPARELGPWLATIARRVSIDIYRRETHRAARPLEAVPADDPALVLPAVTVEETYDTVGSTAGGLAAIRRRAGGGPRTALRGAHPRPDRHSNGDPSRNRQVSLVPGSPAVGV